MSLAAWECVPVVPTTFQFAPSSVAPGLSPGALEEAVSKCTWPPVNSGLGPEALGAAVRWSGSADESGLGPDGGEGERSMSCSIVLPTPSTPAIAPGLGPGALVVAERSPVEPELSPGTLVGAVWPPIMPGLSPDAIGPTAW